MGEADGSGDWRWRNGIRTADHCDGEEDKDYPTHSGADKDSPVLQQNRHFGQCECCAIYRDAGIESLSRIKSAKLHIIFREQMLLRTLNRIILFRSEIVAICRPCPCWNSTYIKPLRANEKAFGMHDQHAFPVFHCRYVYSREMQQSHSLPVQ